MLTDDEVVDAIEQRLGREGEARVVLWGRSMLPTIWPGANVVVERCQMSDLVLGDVALVRRDETFVAHRLIAYRDGRCVFQGDFFDEPEVSLHERQVLGRVASLQVGALSLRVPPAMRTVVNRALLGIMPGLRRMGHRMAPRARAMVERTRRGSVLRRLRKRRLQPWHIEVFGPEHALALRRALLVRGLRPTTRSLAPWEICLRSEHDLGLVVIAERTESIVGYARTHRPPERKHGVVGIYDVWVRGSHRGLGIASKLIESCVRQIRQTPAFGDVVEIVADVPMSRGASYRAFLRSRFVERPEERRVDAEHLRLVRTLPLARTDEIHPSGLDR